jgi:hypothetical protein
MDEIIINIEDKIATTKTRLETDEMYLFTADYTNGKQARVDQALTDEGFIQFLFSISGAFEDFLQEIDNKEEKIELIDKTIYLMAQNIARINGLKNNLQKKGCY